MLLSRVLEGRWNCRTFLSAAVFDFVSSAGLPSSAVAVSLRETREVLTPGHRPSAARKRVRANNLPTGRREHYSPCVIEPDNE
jgi:hypothetical protein